MLNYQKRGIDMWKIGNIEIKNKIEERKSKLQIFCFIDKSPLIVDNLKQFLTTINPLKDKSIFLQPDKHF